MEDATKEPNPLPDQVNPPDDMPVAPPNLEAVIHDLQVHQDELRMQNDELNRISLELDVEREQFADLYHFAPTGYFTLNEKGTILRANLTLAGMLGVDISGLVGHPVTRFIHHEDQDAYDKKRQVLVDALTPQTCEIRFVRKDGSHFWVRLDTVAAQDVVYRTVCRVAVIDITGKKESELALHESEERLRKVFEEGSIGMVLISRDMQFVSANAAFCRMLGYTPDELETRTFLDVTHPEHREIDRENVEAMWQDKSAHYRTEKRYIARDGAIRWGHLSATLIRGHDGQPLYALAMIEDITERKHAEAALQASMEETARVQRTLLALSQAVQAVQQAQNPDEVYRAVGEGIDAIDLQCAVLLLSKDRTYLALTMQTFKSAFLEKAIQLTGLSPTGYRFPLQPDGIFAQCIGNQQTIYTSGTAALLAEVLSPALRSFARQLISILALERSILAPLVTNGESIGVLSVTGTQLCEADMPAISAFATQAAITLRNAQLIADALKRTADLKELTTRLFNAQEEERRRISLEMHDEFGQTLTAIGFDLHHIEQAIQLCGDAKLIERLGSVRALLSELDERVSDLSLDLRPQMLDDLGLLPTLRWYASRYTNRTGIAVALESGCFEEGIKSEVATAIYRIVQEALTNAARHAGASHVDVRIDIQGSMMEVIVYDNGRGFVVGSDNALNSQSHGLGLLGIRERVSLLGGTFDIQSSPGLGTRLTVAIPVGSKE